MDIFTKENRSRVMSRIKGKGNKSTEIRCIALFREHGLTGWRRGYPAFGKPDFVFLKARVAVFVDGDFWHGHPENCRIPTTNRDYWVRKIERNKARDELVTKTLRAKNWRVFRVWESELRKPARKLATLTRMLAKC